MSGFEAAPLRLDSPAPERVRAAYQELPERGALEIRCRPGERAALLRAAEAAGFFGMRLDEAGLRAWKGKAGPCFETGRDAAYRGSAAAALDDDGHLLFGRLRLCEKTAELYRSPAYAGLVEVSEGSPALLARLGKDPAPFDCDTFERDAAALASTLVATTDSGGKSAVYYPGPFRMLILRDGTILKRGEQVLVERGAAEALVARDGALPAPGGATAPNYLTLFRERGAACLLEGAAVSSAGTAPDLVSLGAAPLKLRRRLVRLIERGDDYFILSGSDPAQADGCCPSDDVGAAQVLVRAGVLAAVTASADAACPATIFAFAGELRLKDGRPEFSRNAPLREQALAYLRSGAGLLPRVLLRALLFLLLALGAAGLAWQILTLTRSGAR